MLRFLRKRFETLFPPKAPILIDDPVLHANRGISSEQDRFRTTASYRSYEKALYYHSTGEFSRGDDPSLPKPKYQSHCGPTAITNILMTLGGAGLAPKVSGRSPIHIFEICASLGRKHLLYWNMSLLGYFGGVSLPLTGLYLRLCLRHFDLHRPISFGRYLFPCRRLIRAMKAGHLALINVLFHPTYHSHIMMACGLEVLKNAAGKTLYYVRLADGWTRHPRYLCLNELHRTAFWEVM